MKLIKLNVLLFGGDYRLTYFTNKSLEKSLIMLDEIAEGETILTFVNGYQVTVKESPKEIISLLKGSL